ncbi:hypothetical protein [Flavobacterium branchiophilum]|uniref:hypothetical protein n=1 Tax=Flavobacterium branchiophilum TaxID=55197 RepID=UPI0016802498|nr:hypothetical protein [Flavobacterium branchiophilum]
MNITIKTLRKNDDLIKQLKSSQKELIKECHEDYKIKKFQEVIERLKAKNKLLRSDLHA